MSPTHTAIPVSRRVSQFSYAIRNIVVEAQRVEATGKKVRYLNIGDPVLFGFAPPLHLVEAVERALRDGHNGYGPSAGLASAREAVAAEHTANGWPITADRVYITAGTSEGIELALTALLDEEGEVLVPMPTYPLYTAIIAKLGAHAKYYRCDPSRGWIPDIEHLSSLVSARTRAVVVIDPNNPTGATYPVEARRALLAFAERHGLAILADEVYADLGYDGPVAPLGKLDPDAPIISFSSLSKAYLAPGWRTGWLSIGRSPRLDDVATAIRKLADGRLCSTVPMQYAVTAALTGDKSHQIKFRADLKLRATLTADALRAMPGVTCMTPTAGFYAMPRIPLPPGRTDEEYVLGLLRATGVLVVYGSGFGLPASEGYLRIVFLASPEELTEVYRLMADYTDGLSPVTTAAVARAVLTTALAAAVLAALYVARDALLIIYISGLLATGLGPLVHYLEHAAAPGTQRLPRWLAILLIYLAIVGVLTIVGLLVIPPLVAQAQDLWRRAPELLDRVQGFLVDRGLLDHPLTLEEAVRNAPGPGQTVGTVASAVGSAVTTVLSIITVLILTFYLLVESETLFAGFGRLVPRSDRPRIQDAARKITSKVSAWLSGQLILGGTIGLSAAIGLYLLGVPYFYVLALLAAFGELIPVVGPIFSAVPAILVALTVSPQTALFTTVFFLVQQQVENHLLVPKIMQRQVGVSPVVVIISLLIGGSIFGILGAILAVPSAAIIQVVVGEILDERDRQQDSRDLATN